MNAYQIIKLGAFQANAVKVDGTLQPFFTVPELMAWLNDGNRELEKSIRSIFDDWFVRVLNAKTDTTAQKIQGIDYTPSVSLTVPALTPRITLPPDFETMRSIRCVTTGFEFMEFDHHDMGSQIFREYLRVPADYTVPPGGRIYYDIIGERTLFMTPMLIQPVELEIIYVARTKRLVNYVTGTVAVADTATTVVGTGTLWSTGTPFDSAYLEFMGGVNTFAAIDPSLDYNGANLSRVASITDDTHLELASAQVGALVAGSVYTLSSVPALPPDHQPALADYVTAQMFAKAGNQTQFDRFMAKYEARKASILNTINVRQPDVEFVEDYQTWS